MIKRLLFGFLLIAGALVPVLMAVPALAATGYIAVGTISPYGTPGQCIALAPETDTLFAEPCNYSDAYETWTANQVNGVVYMCLTSTGVFCISGEAVDGNHVGMYDALAPGTHVLQGMTIKGGHGAMNTIRNVRGQFLSYHGGTGPITWNKKGARVNKYKLLQAFTFNGQRTGGGWEEHTEGG